MCHSCVLKHIHQNRGEVENKAKEEAEAKKLAEQEAKATAQAESKKVADVKTKSEAEIKTLAEQNAKSKADADSNAKAEAETKSNSSIEEEKDLARQKEISSRIAEDVKTDRTPPSPVVVKRRARPDAQEREQPAIPSYQRHSMAKNQIEADGYSRYAKSSTTAGGTDGKRKTLHETGFKTADERMQQLNQDEQRRKASYSMLKSRLGEPSVSFLINYLQTFFSYFLLVEDQDAY